MESGSHSRRGACSLGEIGLRLHGGADDGGLRGTHEGADGRASFDEAEEAVDYGAEARSLHSPSFP